MIQDDKNRGGDADHKWSTAQNKGDEAKETSINEFSQAPEDDGATKATKSVYGEGAIRKDDDELIDHEKRLEDHPGAFQIKEKSVDKENPSEDE